MIEIKQDCYKGTRILLGNDKREFLNEIVDYLIDNMFEELWMPNIQPASIFKNKTGEENINMMFGVVDQKGRDLCLAPEYTAIVQNLALTRWGYEEDLKLFYIAECFRDERPQAGRYRQFTQVGVEIINQSKYDLDYLIELALELCLFYTDETSFELKLDVPRGLDYYEKGKGFEILCPALGAQNQICGGGEYEGGVGFALGIDRLMLLK